MQNTFAIAITKKVRIYAMTLYFHISSFFQVSWSHIRIYQLIVAYKESVPSGSLNFVSSQSPSFSFCADVSKHKYVFYLNMGWPRKKKKKHMRNIITKARRFEAIIWNSAKTLHKYYLPCYSSIKSVLSESRCCYASECFPRDGLCLFSKRLLTTE